jgi:uncharacterized membrane protein YccF (DUF307 family)
VKQTKDAAASGPASTCVRETETVRTLLNLIWLVLAGFWLAILYVFASVLVSLTIIGIPLAAGDLKLLPVSINPFGREIVAIDQVSAAVAASRRQS